MGQMRCFEVGHSVGCVEVDSQNESFGGHGG
jgi:hypothetical protein